MIDGRDFIADEWNGATTAFAGSVLLHCVRTGWLSGALAQPKVGGLRHGNTSGCICICISRAWVGVRLNGDGWVGLTTLLSHPLLRTRLPFCFHLLSLAGAGTGGSIWPWTCTCSIRTEYAHRVNTLSGHIMTMFA